MKQSPKRTFVANSIYHIYLSLMYILKNANYKCNDVGENILFLIDRKGIDKEMAPYLESFFFRKVYFIPTFDKQKRGIGKLNALLFRKWTIPPYMEKTLPELTLEEHFISNSEIIICNPCSAKSYFLYKFKNHHFNGIEDGARDYRNIHTTWKIFLRNYITKKPLEGGDDNRIVTFYAQFPNKLPKRLQKKAKELNALRVTSQLSNECKRQLFKAFSQKGIVDLGNKKNALVITQPIAENGIVASEEQKIRIYQEIIESIDPAYNIVIKAHPRETTDYSTYFTSHTFLSGSFPLEIIALNNDIYFEEGYTLFSTSINNMDIIGKKYILGDKFTKYYTSNRWKNKITETVNQFR